MNPRRDRINADEKLGITSPLTDRLCRAGEEGPVPPC